MNKILRMTLGLVAVLCVFALISSVPSVARAEPVGTVSRDSALLSSISPRTPLPGAVWSLGVGVMGVAVISRRKAA